MKTLRIGQLVKLTVMPILLGTWVIKRFAEDAGHGYRGDSAFLLRPAPGDPSASVEFEAVAELQFAINSRLVNTPVRVSKRHRGHVSPFRAERRRQRFRNARCSSPARKLAIWRRLPLQLCEVFVKSLDPAAGQHAQGRVVDQSTRATR